MHRCAWSESDPLLLKYHDEEWGVPEHDSRMLWEMLMLEGFQAGLSWLIVLKRRDGFRKAFKNFDPVKVAKFTDKDVDKLMQDPDIIRARAKIEATIGNAQAYLKMQKEGLDFADYVWEKAGGKPIQKKDDGFVAQSDLSVAFSKDLKKRGFKFVGPVIVYAWLQAIGVLNDHEQSCFRRKVCAARK